MVATVKNPTTSKPLNIFLIEDDDGDAKAVIRAFNKAKIANPIVRAYDGQEALEALQSDDSSHKPESPFIILLDLNMPRMNGIEFLQALRADPNLKQTIVFVLTTSKRDEDKAEAYNLNVAGYIVKETAGSDFLQLIGMVDNYWRLVELP